MQTVEFKPSSIFRFNSILPVKGHCSQLHLFFVEYLLLCNNVLINSAEHEEILIIRLGQTGYLLWILTRGHLTDVRLYEPDFIILVDFVRIDEPFPISRCHYKSSLMTKNLCKGNSTSIGIFIRILILSVLSFKLLLIMLEHLLYSHIKEVSFIQTLFLNRLDTVSGWKSGSH